MQKIAGTLLHNRQEKVGSMPQLPLKKQSFKRNLKEEEPGLPPKNKNNTENIISSQPSLAL
jgi:hypothetical protein